MNIVDHFSSLESVKKILNSKTINIGNSCDGYNQLLLASEFYNSNKTIYVVLPTLFQAQKYYDSLLSFLNEDDVLFFPADEILTTEMISATGDFLYERIQTIYNLLTNPHKIVVTNLFGAIKYEINKNIWTDSIVILKKNMTIDIKNIVNNLIKLGYENVYTTVKTGQFSKRGSIIDIFPLGYTTPIRVDLFGDDIESIKEYNIDTQRSYNEVDNILILPVTEILYDNNDLNLAKNKILSFMDKYQLSEIEEDMYKKDLANLELHTSLQTLSRYITFFDSEANTVFNFTNDNKIYIVDPIKCKELYERISLDINEYCTRIGGYSLSNICLYYDFNKILSYSNIFIEGLRSLDYTDLKINAREIEPYKANQKEILLDFKNYCNRKKLIVCLNRQDRFNKLKEFLEENNLFVNICDEITSIKNNMVNFLYASLPSFDLIDEDLVIINEGTIFDSEVKTKKARYKSIYKNAQKISKYDELCIGDYVVHYDHGIGKYVGIDTLKVGEIERDYIHVIYAKKASVYIPLESISQIVKYASADVEGIELHEMGGTKWAKTKAKVRSRVRDISDKLIKIYSERQMSKGFQFPPDTEEQELFEADFEYELTPDQKKAVDSVKRDMENEKPMDRLICGDVGYGKTEVALRAAFKAVYGGKQVSVLAPTTILARQHYNTFKNRMDKYGIRVEMLSRFVPQKEQKKIIEGILSGSVDVVIGTHRILSNEIKYKDLGLLIIDEEQRFGVTHKEKIKELKVNVDCITLSATPIPRTLQMSVMGLKDLSMIETPPKNRYPVQTYVLQRNDRIIADAIERELARGGQVFYLYNRVETIELEAQKIQGLIPEARICIGHGKMTKDQLENVIEGFIQKKYDILMCTTIIETGIDMPDTNTLIIHDSDLLGLSQMYQIRGRVGRSNKIAYAYLMYEPRKKLTPEAEKRLQTIKEFNELGSGYKIAMRDLSIRGAGDLLGDSQSGFVESVGIDMYMKILNEEIHHYKEPQKEQLDISIKTPLTSRTIRQSYINNDDLRIEVHKKIDALETVAQSKELIEELTDRFGVVDTELRLYIYEKLINKYVMKIGIGKIDKNERFIRFIFKDDVKNDLDGNKLFQLACSMKNIELKNIRGELSVTFNIEHITKLTYFERIVSYFALYCGEML